MKYKKISDLNQKQYSGEIIDNCFFIDKRIPTEMSAIPLKSIFDEIIVRAKKEGLTIEFSPDKIVVLKPFSCRDCGKNSKEYRIRLCEPCYKFTSDKSLLINRNV